MNKIRLNKETVAVLNRRDAEFYAYTLFSTTVNTVDFCYNEAYHHSCQRTCK